MHVYFARDEATGLTKIGTTTCLRARIANLTFEHRQLRLLAVVPGGRGLEAGLHGLLWGYHAGGEWFRPSQALDEIVSDIRNGSFDAAAVPRCKSPHRSEISLRFHAARRARLMAARTSPEAA